MLRTETEPGILLADTEMETEPIMLLTTETETELIGRLFIYGVGRPVSSTISHRCRVPAFTT